MNKGKLKVLIRALKEIQEELESEIYSDTEAYVAKEKFAGNYQGPLYAPHPDLKQVAPPDGVEEVWNDSEE
tara:strand:- start:1824 stop:2036 length:213 start_codon:yes stop_codon:yes gene_type:complete